MSTVRIVEVAYPVIPGPEGDPSGLDPESIQIKPKKEPLAELDSTKGSSARHLSSLTGGEPPERRISNVSRSRCSHRPPSLTGRIL